MNTNDPQNANSKTPGIISFIVVTVIALFLYASFSKDYGPVNSSYQPQTDALSDSQLENHETIYNTSDTVYAGKFKYKIRGVGYNKTLGNTYSENTADGIYLVIKMDLTNNDVVAHTLDNSLFKLTDTLGTEYSSSNEGSTALQMSGYSTLFLKQCNPGIKKSGWLCFEVPKENVYDLHVSDGYSGGQTAAIRLHPDSDRKE